MKYNEAIDMILDGGEAYQKIAPNWVYFFYDTGTGEGSFLAQKNLDSDKYDYTKRYDAQLTKKMFFADDWIVKKDGVVYEEYPINIIKKYIKDRTGAQDGPAELEDNGQEWEEIKMPIIADDASKLKDGDPWMSTEEIREVLESQFPPKPIIADEVNEDWLEKKMLCFMNKYLYPHSDMNLDIKQGQCSNRVCPFCFAQEQPKEQPCEKVALEECIFLLDQYIDRIKIVKSVHHERADKDKREKNLDDMVAARKKLENKLAYLVSLQEE